MNQIIIPALVLGAIGLVLGAILAVASKIFAVKINEKAVEIESVLPGANCGSCGFAGCSAYASAVSQGNAKVNCCSPGGQAVADKVAQIMGVSAEAIEEKKAVVRCSGTTDKAKNKYEYFGEADCVAMAKLQGNGIKECAYGCLGQGSCVKVCPKDAITLENGIAKIDEDKCVGCGECAQVCPKNIISVIPKKNKVYVKCISCDKGIDVKEKCIAGCIGCKICEKNCPEGAITVDNNIAKIDYSKCTQCGLCAEKCPKKVIASNL